MPIYEYRCAQCGTEFEKLVNSRTAVVCPSCQTSKVTRRLSLFGARTQNRFASDAAGASGAMPGGCCGGGGCGCR